MLLRSCSFIVCLMLPLCRYAGDQMETPDGEKYVVVREQDILAKL